MSLLSSPISRSGNVIFQGQGDSGLEDTEKDLMINAPFSMQVTCRRLRNISPEQTTGTRAVCIGRKRRLV